MHSPRPKVQLLVPAWVVVCLVAPLLGALGGIAYFEWDTRGDVAGIARSEAREEVAEVNARLDERIIVRQERDFYDCLAENRARAGTLTTLRRITDEAIPDPTTRQVINTIIGEAGKAELIARPGRPAQPAGPLGPRRCVCPPSVGDCTP